MKKFQRKIEDFTCNHCGLKVKGNGYTNHCSNCLYSKHVDVNPGDRQAVCGGMMKPVSVELKSGGYILSQECQKCGLKRKNKVVKEDNFNTVIQLAQTIAKN